MARAALSRSFLLVVTLCLLSSSSVRAAALSYDYYKLSCPQLEDIVKKKSYEIYNIHGNFATSSIRNFFHDCGVNGCDASILLDSTPGNPSEKESDNNFGQRNYKWFDVIKTEVEKACPGVVSCADVLMLAGREGVINLGGPYIPVKLGRLDSRVSLKADADKQLPTKGDSMDHVLLTFQNLGLNTELAVAMLGGHTIGRTHCRNMVQRLYPTVDPTINPDYAIYLKSRCQTPITDDKEVEYARNDRDTPMGFDNNYYNLIMQGKGHLKVDSDLSTDPRTKGFVAKFAADNAYFYQKFSDAVKIITEYKPLTGPPGRFGKCVNL